MKFTDSEGREYEEVKGVSFMKGAEIDRGLDDVYAVIRQVKQPKYYVTNPALMYDGTNYRLSVTLSGTADQAQLIKECCKELMRVITEARGDLTKFPPQQLLNFLNLASTAMRENN